MRVGKRILLSIILLFNIIIIVNAKNNNSITIQETPVAEENTAKSAEEKFDPGKFMFDHIKDAYSWHIIDFKHSSISIPLPVILYSKERGWFFFISNKLNHGHSTYKGFKIASEGENSGRIVEIQPDGSEVLPFDISISKNIVAIFISIAILLIIFISIANKYKKYGSSAPKGLQSWLEPVILFIRDDVAIPSIGQKHYEKFMPYLLTIFFFIWLNNMLGLIPIFPGGANITGNIAVTMVLAIFTFVITNINGTKIYWQHIVNMPGVPLWLKVPPLPIMPFVEVLGLFTKPFVLMVRLFANITAGHIIGLGFVTLIFLFGEMSKGLAYGLVTPMSLAFMIFMDFLELLVAFIQAYVFTFLSALYFGMAIEEHH